MFLLSFTVVAAFLSGSDAGSISFTRNPIKVDQVRDLGDNNSNSTCHVYSIDFVDGGYYFINSGSDANFTCVSQFDGCQNDTAAILLVNDQTEDEYECSSVLTVPSNRSQLSTCPIGKSQMTTGNWSIITLGNNGKGRPFAWQRNFSLSVEPQQTKTVAPTVTYTLISTPVTLETSTTVISVTTPVPNSKTITVASGTQYATITPPATTTTLTTTITRTFDRWTKTQQIKTETFTASCTVPSRPIWPDTACQITPTTHPLPSGLTNKPQKREDISMRGLARQQSAQCGSIPSSASLENSQNTKSACGEVPTKAIPGRTAVNVTITSTAPTSTIHDFVWYTVTSTITLPPQTVNSGLDFVTVTASPPVQTVPTLAYAVTYRTKTLSLAWTYSTAVTPPAVASACRAEGGHFGGDWTYE